MPVWPHFKLPDQSGPFLNHAAVSAAWSPESLSGLLLWLTAGPEYCFTDAGGTTPAGDGDSVYVWADRSGNGFNFSQATLANRPTLRLASGKWVVRFDGSNDGMSSGSLTVLNGNSLIGVRAAETSATGNSARIVNSTTVNALVTFKRNSNSIYVNANVSDEVFSADNNQHTGILYKASAGNWSFRFDGVSKTLAAVTNEFGRVSVAGVGVSAETFQGDMAGLVVAAVSPSAADLAGLESYLASLA